jgi:hypothetical protein
VVVLAHKVQLAQMEQQIPAAAAERLTFKETHQAQAAQALSFFDTPAQFNTSLVEP